MDTYASVHLKTGLLQKALRCSVFSVRFSEKPVSCTENCLLKPVNLDFAKVLLTTHTEGITLRKEN
jgi:hypothetical protein